MGSGDTAYSFSLAVDPATCATSQQKKVSFRQGRIFTNPRVARTKKAVALLGRRHRAAVRALVADGDPIRLEVTFHYAYPKGTAARRRVPDAPKANGADCDNLVKAVNDALSFDRGKGADLWTDDRTISTLVVRKRYCTAEPPHIAFRVSKDG